MKSCAKLRRKSLNIPIFQTEYTDVGSLRGHAQLRNSATTGILAGERNQKYSFNQGIFLDIFPLDNIPDDKRQRENQAKKSDIIKIEHVFGLNLQHGIAGQANRF